MYIGSAIIWSLVCILFSIPSTRGQCSLNGFDLKNLTSTPGWQFEVESGGCLVGTKCVLQVTFCGHMQTSDVCNGSSVCQVTPDNNSTGLVIGGFSANPFSSISNNNIIAKFPQGQVFSPPFSQTCNTSVKFQFTCDKAQPWIPSTTDGFSAAPRPYYISRSMGTCAYVVGVTYAGACRQTTPPTVHYISPGSIILIVFVILVGGYFIFGTIYNVVAGKQGIDIIPHHTFWGTLPYYIVGGCMFAYQKVTCRGRPRPIYDRIT